jgi:hypothetical protein
MSKFIVKIIETESGKVCCEEEGNVFIGGLANNSESTEIGRIEGNPFEVAIAVYSAQETIRKLFEKYPVVEKLVTFVAGLKEVEKRAKENKKEEEKENGKV